MNSSKSILAGGIIGLALLIIFGFFSSDVELEYSEPVAEVESKASETSMVECPECGVTEKGDYIQPAGYNLSDYFNSSAAEVGPIIYDDDYIVEKFVSGLEFPTTMTFVGDDILVLEKNTGKVIRIQDNGVIYNEPVLDVPVIFQHEAGLLGTASTSNHIYLYFTESPSGFDKFNHENARNVVYQYDWNGKKLTNPILIKVLPGHLSIFHHGGVITTGLNNEIYFVIGDQRQQTTFQNTLVETIYETGSIFKIDTESNNSVELFAMGIRNSFGLAVDPVTGYLWDTENGPDIFDEINLVKYGFNSGWKLAMGPVVDSSTIQKMPFENFVYSDPEFSWYQTVAPTAIVFPDNDGFRKYSDWLFVGDLNNGRIYKFQLNADRTGFIFSNPELSDLVLDNYDHKFVKITGGIHAGHPSAQEIDEILFAKAFPGGITDIKFHDDVMYVVSIFEGSIYKIYLKEHLKKIEKIKFEMLKLLKTRTGIEYINLSNSDLSGSNFYTAKISNVNFTQTNLSHANLSNKDLTGTILTGANLTDANLANVDLSGKDLTGTILVGADLSGKDLTGTILVGADLTDANLANVDLSGKDLTGTILVGADLTDMDITGTILRGADLSNTILTGVDLSTDCSKVFSFTNGTRIQECPWNLIGTILTGADLTDSNLTGANLSGKDLTGTILWKVNLLDANLAGANLTNADLRNTLLVDANLSNAILRGADLTNANLTDAILTGANLDYAIFTNTILNCVGHPVCVS